MLYAELVAKKSPETTGGGERLEISWKGERADDDEL